MRPSAGTVQYTLRSGTSVVAFWAGVVVSAIVIVVPALQAEWNVLAFVLGPALLLVWMLWMVLYRPAVRYDTRHVVISNIGRTHVLPWPQIIDIRQRLGIDFEINGGGVVRAVGISPPRRAGNVASNFDQRTRPAYDFDRNVEILEGFRRAAAPTDEPVSSRWDVFPLTIGAALIIIVAGELLFGV